MKDVQLGVVLFSLFIAHSLSEEDAPGLRLRVGSQRSYPQKFRLSELLFTDSASGMQFPSCKGHLGVSTVPYTVYGRKRDLTGSYASNFDNL